MHFMYIHLFLSLTMGGGTNYESARSQKNSSSSRCMRACKEEGDLKIGKIERTHLMDGPKIMDGQK